MQNPFAFKSAYSKAYWLFWGLIAIFYTAILRLVFNLPYDQATADSFLFCLSFALIGLIIWNVVNYSSLEKDRVVNTLITHVVAAALLVFIWSSLIQKILNSLFLGYDNFYAFNSELHYYRIIGGFVLYVFITLLYYLTIYYEEYQHKKAHEVEIEKHLKVAELSMLKAQINPHFYF